MNLRAYVMEPRPDWNSIGPRLPAWFRIRLQRIDPRLVLQFIPPRTLDCTDGVDPIQFPGGVWVICRRMRSSGWLFKRWIWSLLDKNGCYLEPGADTIDMIRLARDLWRRNNLDVLERRFDDAVEATKVESQKRSRAHMREYIEQLCRVHDIVSHRARISMGRIPGAG